MAIVIGMVVVMTIVVIVVIGAVMGWMGMGKLGDEVVMVIMIGCFECR